MTKVPPGSGLTFPCLCSSLGALRRCAHCAAQTCAFKRNPRITKENCSYSQKYPTRLFAVTFSCVRFCLNYSIGLQVWAVLQFKQEAEEFLWAWNLLISEFHYIRQWQNLWTCREWNHFPTACEHHLISCSWTRVSTKALDWWKIFQLLEKVELYFISNLHFTNCGFELCCPFYACFSWMLGVFYLSSPDICEVTAFILIDE